MNYKYALGISSVLLLGATSALVYYLVKNKKNNTNKDSKNNNNFDVDNNYEFGYYKPNNTTSNNNLNTNVDISENTHEAVANNLSKELNKDKSFFIKKLSDGSYATALTYENKNIGKFAAIFYNNGRLFIKDEKNNVILKANYYFGGKRIEVTEGYNKGLKVQKDKVIEALKSLVYPKTNV